MPFKFKDPDTGELREFTFDVGDDPDNELTCAEQPPITPDLGVDTTGWDINKKTRRTLGEYVNQLTHGDVGSSKRGNEYGVDAEQTTYENTTPTGYPTSPRMQYTGQNQNSEGYMQDVRDIPELGYSSTSQDYANAVQRQFVVHKGVFKSGVAKEAASQNGNSLLKSIDVSDGVVRSDPENSKVVTGYVNPMMSRNRFTPASPCGDNDTAYIPTEMGKDDLNDDTHAYTQARLANVGLILSMRASGEWGSTQDGVNPTSAGVELKAILPGANQIGIERVNVNEFDVNDIMQSLTTSEDVNEINVNDKSWGALNNVYDQYSGAGAAGMQVLSLSLLVSVLLLMEVFGMIFSFLTRTEFKATDQYGRRALGSFLINTKNGDPDGFPPSLGPALLGLNPTKNDLREAVEEGMKAFYGLDEVNVSSLSKKVARAALGAVIGSQDTPGLQIAVSRTILRSSIALKDAVSNIGGNPVAIIKGILGLIDVIKRSKFIVAVNLFSALGDQIITNKKNGLALDKPLDSMPGRYSAMDAQDPDVTNAARMNRLFRTSIIAWGAHRAPAQFLMPSALVMPSSVAQNMNVQSGPSAIPSVYGRLPYSKKKLQVINSSNGRIDTATREKFETELDAEYVPFYFHDLRTNEITSFHAFLQSLNDGYSANWENSEGIGRIDPVKIYKNTTRKIDLSFFIVSTNDADFDVMWLKINKLLTLLYPQFTRGRTIFDGDSVETSSNVIVQPFSQVMAASPVIRLRVGDVVRSNYSKFNLARLFGFGMPEMKIEGKSMKLAEGDVATGFDRVSQEIQKIWEGNTVPPAEYRFEIDNGTCCTAADASNDYAPVWTVNDSNPQAMPSAELLSCQFVRIDNGVAIVKIGLKGVDELTKSQVNALNVKSSLWTDSSNTSTYVVGGNYSVPIRNLSFTNKTYDALSKKLSFGVSSDVGDSLNTFMSDDKNVLVKSFKETGGKGLAGVIESMNFSWIDNTPWEIDPDRTAPKMCKVSMNFAPIHDIAPGLDWQGYNRGPVYPVGTMCAPNVKGKT